VKHCLSVIDNYSDRIESMKASQREYKLLQKSLQTRQNAVPIGGSSHLPGLKTGKRKDLRNELLNAIRKLLYRLYDEHFIDESTLRQSASQIGIEVSVP
jgi:hypothetical protein